MTPKLILASTSPFRKTLLNKFNIPFLVASPNIDETAYENETAQTLVERLSIEKSQAISTQFETGIVIGSDQVAVFKNEIIGKPHNKKTAIAQLTQFSGNKVTFLTGLALYKIETKQVLSTVEKFQVQFKTLTPEQIDAYLEAEQPYNCAGSFKSEGLGICLFERFIGDDPNSLVGLPLIALNRLLLEWNIDILLLQK
ncbi:Maf family protein [Pseudoalteromonas denitrificans]|jgi:MAF protein|uniref:7-methyl-GTP pyrophosphatase n=1 Tax=Pseudoalteromonas denitrificans DSM 6059 TaxID=1123010 RepID=A0A1I1QDW3_9GAMM|nr:nucleoside triphosphate pyrophosphatase [Pseudoalteromonas denitrificans]SFD17423.1 MAF protein [Pseudoalteromonas denitrificans DSM 6059]